MRARSIGLAVALLAALAGGGCRQEPADLVVMGGTIVTMDRFQPTDLASYQMMLAEMLRLTAGSQMTEVAGFFSGSKYSNGGGRTSIHEGVPTEWETVHLISPYNCYQNTVARDCYNQSLHSQAPIGRLKQTGARTVRKLDSETYICILMADYDSATPLYERMPENWSDARRGSILLWGINPNLVETYPDIIQHLYATQSQNDYFGADASAAGYMNPSRIRKEYLPLFISHNQKFYGQLRLQAERPGWWAR